MKRRNDRNDHVCTLLRLSVKFVSPRYWQEFQATTKHAQQEQKRAPSRSLRNRCALCDLSSRRIKESPQRTQRFRKERKEGSPRLAGQLGFCTFKVMLKVISIQVADAIDIKSFKAFFTAEIYRSDADELFYRIGPEKYLYVFKYGILCFLGYSKEEISTFIQSISPFCKNLFDQWLSDEFDIETRTGRIKLGYNKIEIAEPDIEVFRLIMLNVSQSVALDHYNEQTNKLLTETNYYTQMLERKGKINLRRTNLKKYIGRTLNLKNRIAENLYIFDSPDITWEDEKLNLLDQDLKTTFDLQARFRTIEEGLEIVKENLELFKDMLQYRNTVVLETIVIILILVEVINLFIEKLFPHM